MLNHHSARRELEFVDAEIDSLIESGCVVVQSALNMEPRLPSRAKS